MELCIRSQTGDHVIQCSFALNNQPISTFRICGLALPAFSGLAPYVNVRSAGCLADVGPIPPGRYYIVDRQSGGRLGWLHDRVSGKADWFSLYADDGKTDDETFCDQVTRGNFRLHPRGLAGISRGCIVIDSPGDFGRLRTLLIDRPMQAIPGSALRAYGIVTVE